VRRTHEKLLFEGCRAAPNILQTAVIELNQVVVKVLTHQNADVLVRQQRERHNRRELTPVSGYLLENKLVNPKLHLLAAANQPNAQLIVLCIAKRTVQQLIKLCSHFYSPLFSFVYREENLRRGGLTTRHEVCVIVSGFVSAEPTAPQKVHPLPLIVYNLHSQVLCQKQRLRLAG
jgi:hypothetical protein